MSKINIACAVLVSMCAGIAPSLAGQISIVGDTAVVNGMEMYYEQVGDGPPLLLLHHFSGCSESWHPHVERLARHYRLIIPDLRGHGRSTNPSGQFTHRQAALDIFGLLDELAVQRFRAMGMSSGGMTLIHMATQQPDRIEAMVLIGATTHFPETARVIFRHSVRDSMTASEVEEWRACSSRGDAQTWEVIGQFHRMKDSYDDMNFTTPYLSTITAPTLIVHGDRDEIFPVSIPLQMYAAIPNSYLWIVPNGGHIPIFGDEAEAFRERALVFLGGRWTRGGH